MKVTSSKSVSFPKLNWGISAGDVRELPEGEEAQKQILAHAAISPATASKSEARRTEVMASGSD